MELLPNAEYNESMKALIRQEPTLFSPSVGSCLIVNIVSSIQVCYTMFSIRISLLFYAHFRCTKSICILIMSVARTVLNKQYIVMIEDKEMELTHLDEHGAARMVDVGAKEVTQRIAIAQAVITMKPETTQVRLVSTLRCTHKTGIEMEALTAASVAALTIYDMCKAVDRAMRIDDVLLLHKDGGKSGTYQYQRKNEENADEHRIN